MSKVRHIKITSPMMMGTPIPNGDVCSSDVGYTSGDMGGYLYGYGTDISYRVSDTSMPMDVDGDYPSGFIKCPYCGVDNDNLMDIYCVGCGAPIDHSRKEW